MKSERSEGKIKERLEKAASEGVKTNERLSLKKRRDHLFCKKNNI